MFLSFQTSRFNPEMGITVLSDENCSLFHFLNSHYPTTKFTTVADTPENRRLAKNTKTQSQV